MTFIILPVRCDLKLKLVKTRLLMHEISKKFLFKTDLFIKQKIKVNVNTC